MNKRVVITGMGVVSPLGNEIDKFWNNLVAGTNGVTTQDWLVEEGYNATVAATAKDEILIDDVVDFKEARRMDPFTRYSVHSAKAAIAQSGLDTSSEDPTRMGVIIGSGVGGLYTFEEQHAMLIKRGHRRVSPFFIPMMIPDIAAGYVSIIWGLKGPNFSVNSACATAAHAVGLGMRAIRYGDADVMVCGGADAALTHMGFAGFANMKALSFNPDPDSASRPFDKARDGFVMGEGAGVFVLESLEHAQARGANILAELSGFGMTADAYHITSPASGGEGANRAMKMALADGDLIPTDIDYINAHGTSTPANDKNESIAIKNVFGDHAYKLSVSSTKSMTGHLLGASGGIELAALVKTVMTNTIAPTIHHENPCDECDLNYTPGVSVQREVRAGISNSFGFGGHNAVLAVKEYKA
ncbi:MAG: beta-ketoacyl-ACP synthase II [Candidatus Marinimicrobia bacterium]|jgi:beta-ketoacyl-acyl-carrier-protein synthase II|nr:beta-ketoacyl-ACP synthase II [Candidatus Neomarinimicrobiota bacterium]MBT3576516.1 beta-ketoacyl-ACP synthase II [Candidatus Neomarinimicrobiota bacterium]MBT3681302.1 beta-ketoacyl-ACP synthase II [Candidatus Neomarinimicrobiota bacterium]MBT3951516.1 beta-ketoacyl-ACP synthase II [Candidatus Neomarinimicrobiota bacterium]MBT4253908.1 beta-ketoacyl-ACP synthase II [Candidatus Neomarinimicrobiota bacterium]